MKITRFTLLITLFLFNSLSAQDGWFWQNPKPQGNNLNGVHYVDFNTIVAVGDAGTILRSTNSGTDWIRQECNSREDLYGVYFIDSLIGTVVGANGTILRTIDGGRVWKFQNNWTSATLKSVHFINTSTGSVVGQNGTILRTTDGGATWEEQFFGSKLTLNKVYFSDIDTGFVVGDKGLVVLTTNGGRNWKILWNPGMPHIDLFDMHFKGKVGSVVGLTGLMYRTTDLGVSWTKMNNNIGTDLELYATTVISSDTILIAGKQGVLVSVNRGDSWYYQWAGTYQIIRAMSFYDRFHGVMVADNGVISLTTDCGGVWKATYGYLYDLKAIHFIHPYSGATAGGNGLILVTSDGGGWWRNYYHDNNSQSYNFESVFMVDPDKVYAVGYSSTNHYGIFASARYMGAISTTSIVDSSNVLYSCHFIDGSIGTTVGENGVVYRTSDGGATWIKQDSKVMNTLRGVHFVDSLTGMAVGTTGTIIKTIDGGKIWFQLDSVTNIILSAVRLLNENVAFIVGANGIILKTTNGGINWSELQSGTKNLLKAISIVDSNIVTVAGERGTILRSDDGGITWQTQDCYTHKTLNGIYFVNRYRGFAVGDDGAILATRSGGILSVKEIRLERSFSKEVLLYQNYPNPFSTGSSGIGSTTIRFNLPEPMFITLKVYNSFGQEIETLLRGMRDRGVYDVVWNAWKLRAGIYYYQLLTQSTTNEHLPNGGQLQKHFETRKIILVR